VDEFHESIVRFERRHDIHRPSRIHVTPVRRQQRDRGRRIRHGAVLQSPERERRLRPRRTTMVRAYVLISTSPGKAMDVASQLTGQDGIVQSDAITGEYDVIAQVEAKDVAGVGALIVEKIQRIDGVFKTVTCLAVK